MTHLLRGDLLDGAVPRDEPYDADLGGPVPGTGLRGLGALAHRYRRRFDAQLDALYIENIYIFAQIAKGRGTAAVASGSG